MRLSVLHGPKNVGSQASSLARAENQVRRFKHVPGRSWSVNFAPSERVAPADEDYPLRRLADQGLAGKIAYALGPLRYGLRRRGDFDVLHLYFGESLFSFSRRFEALEMLDLRLWRAMGKTLFMTFQGCDARQKGPSSRNAVSACKEGFCRVEYCDLALDARRRRMIEKVRRWCDKVFCLNPDLLRFVEGAEFLPYCSAEPALLEAELPPRAAGSPPVVLHAPTERSIKGTAILERVSAELQARLPHRLVMVEGVSREKALRMFESADVVVDQLLVGWYGGVGLEAMSLGLPVVAYINEVFFKAVPVGMSKELPVVNATADTLADTLARLLSRPEERAELGRRGRAFVRRWHDPVRIASRMLDLYRDPSKRFWDDYDPEASG